MELGIIGLGKMGANMARRLRRGGIEVVGYNRSAGVVRELASADGLTPAESVAHLVAQLQPPRVVWLMLPAGEATEQTIHTLIPILQAGDLIVDGGNANYRDTLRRGAMLRDHDLRFVDAGTSGGIWGLEEGYCLMVGGDEKSVALLAPALQVLAPGRDRGWAHVGPLGAGHFTKMIHNGVEYGMMQALAEGLSVLRSKTEFGLDPAQVTELWRHGSVVRSWLLDLTAAALAEDSALEHLEPVVADSGEGRWTAIEAIEQGVPAPVMTGALQARFTSQGSGDYASRLLAVMRNAFGGHAVKEKSPAEDQ